MAELTTVARPYAEAAFRASVDAKDVSGYGEKLQLFGAAAATREAASSPLARARAICRLRLLMESASGPIVTQWFPPKYPQSCW